METTCSRPVSSLRNSQPTHAFFSSRAPTGPVARTTVFAGSLNRKNPARSFSVTAAAGSLTGSLSFSKAKSLSLAVKSSTGQLLASGNGPSVLKVLTTLPASGTYALTVSGSGNATFTLSVGYPG